MTLRETLIEHYVSSPQKMVSVRVNGCETGDWEREVRAGDLIEVDWGIPGKPVDAWRVEPEINP